MITAFAVGSFCVVAGTFLVSGGELTLTPTAVSSCFALSTGLRSTAVVDRESERVSTSAAFGGAEVGFSIVSLPLTAVSLFVDVCLLECVSTGGEADELEVLSVTDGSGFGTDVFVSLGVICEEGMFLGADETEGTSTTLLDSFCRSAVLAVGSAVGLVGDVTDAIA